MITNESTKEKTLPSYKMTEDERIEITNQLKDAIEMNKKNPQKREWDSTSYRNKYGI